MDLRELFGIPNPENPSFRDILNNLDLWTNPLIYSRGIDMSLSERLNHTFDAQNTIENAAVYTPEAPRENSFDSFLTRESHNFISSIGLMPKTELGPKEGQQDTLRTHFEGKYIMGTTAFAGLGHFKELVLLMQKIGTVSGVGAWMLQPEQCLPETDRAMFEAKIKLHTLMQTETLDRKAMNEMLTTVLSKSPMLLDKISAVVGHNAMDLAMGATGYLKDKETLANRVAVDLIDRVNKNPAVAKALMNLVAMIDINVSEGKLPGVITTVLNLMRSDGIEPELISTTHPANLRAFIRYLSQKDVFPSGRVFSLTPDSGYAEEEEELVKGIIEDLNNTEVFAGPPGIKTDSVHCSPSDKITAGFRDVFDNRGPIVTTGEMLDSITVSELALKWNMRHRNVALMVNGNASNAGMIRQSVNEYIAAGCPKDITLAVCIFKQDPEKIFGEDWPTIRDVIATNSKQIKLVRAQNNLDAALVSQHIPKWAHMVIGKPPGENAFMSAAAGCVEACAYSPISNEKHNMVYNLDKALMSTYPPQNKERWQEFLLGRTKREQKAAQRGLAIEADNFVDYIHALDRNGFAKQFALDGYANSDHLNTMHIILIKLVQMLEGGLSEERHNQIIDYMALAQDRFNYALGQDYLKHFGWSPVSRHTPVNKYYSMERELRKPDPEEVEWVKPAVVIGIIAAVIMGGLILSRRIEDNKNKKLVLADKS